MFVLPNWTNNLKNYYVVIRVDGRNKAIRRKYYRLVEAEKLRLSEIGYCQECIRLCCRYLSVKRLTGTLKPCGRSHNQLFFDFYNFT